MPRRVISLLVLASMSLAACASDDENDVVNGPTTDAVGTTDEPWADASPSDGTGADGTDADGRAVDGVPTEPSTGSTDHTDGAGDDGIDPAAFVPTPIEWEPFDETVRVGTLDVPVDYADPGGPTFELFLARHDALDPDARIGTLLVNVGGPGFGSADLAIFADRVFDRELLDHFDIVGWDPRGTGDSEPAIDCVDDYDPYFAEIDATPDGDAERDRVIETARDFAARCVERNAGIIEQVGTNNSARDMDVIRRALGEDRISYFGFSYGSELGATWATLFPETVRAAVFDGAADPTADSRESGLQQLRGFEASLETFLARCADDDGCAFHNEGEPEAALEALLVDLDRAPIDVDEDDRPPVNRDVAINGILQAMYSERYWPALERSLDEAQDGDGSGLLALHDAFFQRRSDGTYGNELEAFQAISCADQPDRPTIEEVEEESGRLHEVAPLLVPDGTLAFFCTFFPPAVDPRIEITGSGAGPILVIGTTGDPATPLESSERMAAALEDGRLVIVEANEHTGYGVNRCVVDIVNDHLVELEPPDDGTECR